MSAEKTWRDKADEIIARHCRLSWQQANLLPSGKPRKRHVPYSVPQIADALVKSLNADDEHEAKRLFMVEATGSWSLI